VPVANVCGGQGSFNGKESVMSEKEKEKEVPVESKKRRGQFWWVLVAGIVLMIVYQSGRSAGVHSAMESMPTVSETPTPVVAENTAAPRVRATVKAETPAPAVERNTVVVRSRVASANGGTAVANTSTPVRAAEGNTVRTRAASANEGTSVANTGIPVRAAEGNIPVRIVNRSTVGTAREQFLAAQKSSVAPKPSELGVMPLQPLTPLQPLPAVSVYSSAQSTIQSATVYSGVQSAAQTTFKSPTLAPVVPIAKPVSAPGERSVSPVRITTAADCDCGKAH